MTHPLHRQPGGTHYRKYAIQPVEYTVKNGLSFLAGNVVKYVTRYKDKGGEEDIRKAMHYLELILEFEFPKVAVAPPEAVIPQWAPALDVVAIAQPDLGLHSGPSVLKPGDEGYER